MRKAILIFALVTTLPVLADDRQADRDAIRAHIDKIFQAYIHKDRETVRLTHAKDWRGFLTGSHTILRGIDDYMREADYGLKNTNGVVTEFAIPTPGSFPVGIAAGPDGNLWFAEQGGKKIGRITPAGVITEFLVPPRGPFDAAPHSIAAGPDGNIWFSERFVGRIGRITPAGTITLFIVDPDCCATPGEITAGADGNLWFTDDWDNKIVRITTLGVMDSFSLGTPGFSQGSSMNVYGIAAGPDGALWYTHTAGRIGRITTGGIAFEFAIPTPGSSPQVITAGPDGNMWFTENGANKIGRIAAASRARRRAVRPR